MTITLNSNEDSYKSWSEQIASLLPAKVAALFLKIEHFIPTAFLIGMGRIMFLALFFVLAKFTLGNEFGLFTVVFAASQLTGMATMLGTGPTASVIIPQALLNNNHNRVGRYLRFSFVVTLIGIIILLALAITAYYICIWQGWHEGARIAVGLVIFGPLMSVSMLREFLCRAFERSFLAFAPRDIWWCVGFMVLIAFVPESRLDVLLSASIVLAVTETIAWIMFYHLELRKFAFRSISGPLMVKSWWNRSLAIVSNYIGGLGFERIDVILIGMIGGLHLAAVYSVANRVAPLISMCQRFIVPVLSPRMSRHLKAENYTSVKKEALIGLVVALLYSGPLFLGVMFFAEDLMSIFGGEYALGADVLRILAFAHLMIALGSNFGVVLMVGKTPWLYARTIWIALIIATALLFLVIPEFGLVGTALTMVSGISLYNIINTILAWRSLDSR